MIELLASLERGGFGFDTLRRRKTGGRRGEGERRSVRALRVIGSVN